MAPIYNILNEKKLKLNTECESAFVLINKMLSTYPVLSFPRFGEEDSFILTTDGSGSGVGAVLSQMQDGQERALGFASVAFNKAQARYTTTEKELAAIRFGVLHFKPYLFWCKYIIRTDHEVLTYLDQMKVMDARLLRTYEDIQLGDYEIQYIRSSENKVADLLSRTPIDRCMEFEDATIESSDIVEEPIFVA